MNFQGTDESFFCILKQNPAEKLFIKINTLKRCQLINTCGAVLVWHKSTGKLQFQGTKIASQALEQRLKEKFLPDIIGIPI